MLIFGSTMGHSISSSIDDETLDLEFSTDFSSLFDLEFPKAPSCCYGFEKNFHRVQNSSEGSKLQMCWPK
jgi:hypothetical protein